LNFSSAERLAKGCWNAFASILLVAAFELVENAKKLATSKLAPALWNKAFNIRLCINS
jgi:hypothetical protein